MDVKLLLLYGARKIHFKKGEFVFYNGDRAGYFFQVLSGEIKMNNYNQEGKEFIQGIFSEGRSFGESPLFGDFNYPANAETIKETTLLRLPKADFFQLLSDHPEIHFEITQTLAGRLYFKAMMASEIASNEADDRILALLDYLKTNIYKIEGEYAYEVELTRQQIADLTGLRVETVIRKIKTLEKKGSIKIINRKVWR